MAAHKSKSLLFETLSNGFHCKNTVHLVHSIIQKDYTLNPFAIRILKTPKCQIHNNVGQANNLFLRKYVRKKKVISEVLIAVIFEDIQSVEDMAG